MEGDRSDKNNSPAVQLSHLQKRIGGLLVPPLRKECPRQLEIELDVQGVEKG
jgi:hypothetical protein